MWCLMTVQAYNVGDEINFSSLAMAFGIKDGDVLEEKLMEEIYGTQRLPSILFNNWRAMKYYHVSIFTM